MEEVSQENQELEVDMARTPGGSLVHYSQKSSVNAIQPMQASQMSFQSAQSMPVNGSAQSR